MDPENGMDAKPVVHFIGPPGCGKGTVAEYLSRNIGCITYSVGQLMRDEVISGSELGVSLQGTLQGNIANPDLAMQVISKHLRNRRQLVILDGFPRNIAQADAYVAQIGKPDLVVVINVTNSTALARLAGRGVTSGRGDDSNDIELMRMEKYKDETFPVIGHLKALGCVVLEFDGENTPEEVGMDVCNAIKSHTGM